MSRTAISHATNAAEISSSRPNLSKARISVASSAFSTSECAPYLISGCQDWKLTIRSTARA